MWKIVKMPIADWLPYPPPLYINIGFGLRQKFVDVSCFLNLTARKVFSWASSSSSNLTFEGDLSSFNLGFSILSDSRNWDSRRIESLEVDIIDDRRWSAPFDSESFWLKNIVESTETLDSGVVCTDGKVYLNDVDALVSTFVFLLVLKKYVTMIPAGISLKNDS